ncbi:hypothetical protein [Georgenia muralis]|uniref:Tail assembly chaperone E/41/14-like protein n=1 Tax=Georgenia muralis TaxID=154117 RepID=A0A3N4Z6G2_9MICO|nr:hypothetical protein [Georgenia muralis]RPF28999.1 hypothetical protein EDD32_3550 [Georgenia muralis]
MFATEVDFTLPKGYLDADGVLHTDGVMRLATAADEILPLKDPRVQANPAYLTIIVLARVVTRLGSLPDVNTKVVEGLFASDLDYLQVLYERLNAAEEPDGRLGDDDGQLAGSADGRLAGGGRVYALGEA